MNHLSVSASALKFQPNISHLVIRKSRMDCLFFCTRNCCSMMLNRIHHLIAAPIAQLLLKCEEPLVNPLLDRAVVCEQSKQSYGYMKPDLKH